MIRRTSLATLHCALFVLLFTGTRPLPAQTRAQRDRIIAAEAAAARERAEKANPPGRFDDKVNAVEAVKQSDIDAAFRTKADMEFFLKQEAWRKENQRRIDFENSPAGRAQAQAAIEAEKLRRRQTREAKEAADAAAEAALEAAIRIKNFALNESVADTAREFVRRAHAGDMPKMTYRENTALVNLAEALLTDGEFDGQPVASLGLRSDARGRHSMALDLYGIIGWLPGGEKGRYNENWPAKRRVMDLVMPAALLKGGSSEVVVRQVRALQAIGRTDARTQMQIAVGLIGALATPTGDLTPTQRTNAAALLADRVRDIPPGSGKSDDPDGPAFSWMLLAAAERLPELARAPSLQPHFAAQSALRPQSVWRSATPAPRPAEIAAKTPTTAQGNWWNLAGMLVLAEKSQFPHPWFAAMRNERRVKHQAPAPAESRAFIQRALDDWFARNGTTAAVRQVIQSDCDLTCTAGVEKLTDSAAWDDFIETTVLPETGASPGDPNVSEVLTSPRLKTVLEASGGDTTGAQRWLVDPHWQPGANAAMPIRRLWFDLAGPTAIELVVARNPGYLSDPWFFRRGLEALRPTKEGQLSHADAEIAKALIAHAADITEPADVRALAIVRGRCLGDWIGLSAWLDDPRRRPKPSDPWFVLYEQANCERDQVAGKIEKFKLGSDEDFARCARFEAWLTEVLKAEGAARTSLLAACPDQMLTQPEPRIVGYDLERGGLASRALLLLASAEFDPHQPVENGGHYNPDPWLTAVAKLPPRVSMEELMAQFAAAVRIAWSAQRNGHALDSTLSIRAGVACQRALGRLASRWSPARVSAQEEILNLRPDVIVEGIVKPGSDCIEARIKWERALMKGLPAAAAFAEASLSLRRHDLSYLVALSSESPPALPPLVLADDEHFFREARRALAGK